MVASNGREYAIFFAIAACVVGLPVLRRYRRADAAGQRAAVLAGMGFVESTREEVFGDGLRAFTECAARSRLGSISPWVCTGRSALGETLIFDLATDRAAEGTPATHTVIAFRVGGPVGPFNITHLDSIDRLAMHAMGTDPGTTASGEALFDVPVVSATQPDLAKHYRVIASDPERMRRTLTAGFVDALGRIDGRKLHIHKSGSEWLFFERITVRPRPPRDYPALLREAVELLRLLDLRIDGASR